MKRNRPRVPPPKVIDGNPFEKTTASYARNLLVLTSLRHLHRSHSATLEDLSIFADWASSANVRDCKDCQKHDDLVDAHFRDHMRAWLHAKNATVPVVPPSASLRANLSFIGRALDLSSDELAVLQFVTALQSDSTLSTIVDIFDDVSLPQGAALISAATRIPRSGVWKALQPDSRLRVAGLLDVEPGDKQRLTCTLRPKMGLLDLLSEPRLNRQRFLCAYLKLAAPPTLTTADYADHASVAAARAVLAGALRERAAGINILLHGSTGVGKTELARLLASEVGVPLYMVDGADSAGGSATEHERLSSLMLANALSPRSMTLILFDEMEDLFSWNSPLFTSPRATTRVSKQWLGNMLERNPVPTIWCTNKTEGIDPAFLRRFSYAIEIKAPGSTGRAKILLKHVGREGGITRAEADQIGERFEACPAQIAASVRSARLVTEDGRVDRPGVEAMLAPVHKLLTGVDARLKQLFQPAQYRLDALNCHQDLHALATQLTTFTPTDGPGVPLCLYGPPGTGKSEFVKYLAHRTGRPLVYRRASDIMSKWVGDNERNIATAFDEAKQEGALLLFDEADSFLRDRRDALRSWEVTVVNEFLQQLEVFPGIVACTTNLWKDMDEAALRRFVFKLEMRYPSPTQVWSLFGHYFPSALKNADTAKVRGHLGQLCNVAPGDFAAVSRRVRALGASPSADDLVRMLGEEVAVKRGATRPIGF